MIFLLLAVAWLATIAVTVRRNVMLTTDRTRERFLALRLVADQDVEAPARRRA